MGRTELPAVRVTFRHKMSITGACPRRGVRFTTRRARPARSVISGTEDATAPRSARGGWRFRGSRGGSLHSPARDPRLFHRPLRGRGIHRPPVVELTVPRSWNSPYSVAEFTPTRGRGTDRYAGRCVTAGVPAVAESRNCRWRTTAPRLLCIPSAGPRHSTLSVRTSERKCSCTFTGASPAAGESRV